ncbi:unnamed protein product [Phytophthora fragariaefolia]|uniref:Unnamed protein product n=1 Tax=Phytophthora fragariaefolia TaxID=1490495 RepID=A0A9W6U4D4_9STRA|nr:unnamed protein product [Phytophthora fragariaefolia]
MEYERGAENLPVDTNMSTGSPNAAATHVAREDCPHLADSEWETLQRLSTVIGEAAVATMLRTLSPTEQHGVALGFIMKEQREIAARATVSTLSTPRVESLKLHHDVHAYAQRARYLVSNIVTNPMDEATKVVTFMKGLRDGPVKTYLFREYPGTLEAAITLAMQEAFILRQAKLHANVPRPIPRPVVKPTRGPEPMDLSSATTAGPQQRRGSTNVRCFRCGNNGHYARECTASVHAAKGRDDTGHSHCKKKDVKPNLVTVKVNSKRESSLRALVDCGASNNFVRLQSLARLDFEEVELPRSLLEVRLATGVVVRTEKRVVRARFSYEEKKFVDELIVLDLDDKFDMVLGMPWFARHDPVIDWAKRTIVRFRSSGATESDGPVGAAHAPRGAYDPPAEAARDAAASDLSVRTLTAERVVREKCEPNQETQIRSDLSGSRSVKGDAVVSTVVDTQVEQEWPVTEGSDLGASAPGADAIGPNIKGRSAVRRRGRGGAWAPGADAASSADVSVRDRDLRTDTGLQYRKMALESPPTLASELTSLPAMSWKRFARDLHDGRIEQICILSDVERMKNEAEELKQLVTEGADALSAKSKKERFDEQSWDSLKSSPLYEVLREFKDVLPDDIPAGLPRPRVIRTRLISCRERSTA